MSFMWRLTNNPYNSWQNCLTMISSKIKMSNLSLVVKSSNFKKRSTMVSTTFQLAKAFILIRSICPKRQGQVILGSWMETQRVKDSTLIYHTLPKSKFTMVIRLWLYLRLQKKSWTSWVVLIQAAITIKSHQKVVAASKVCMLWKSSSAKLYMHHHHNLMELSRRCK